MINKVPVVIDQTTEVMPIDWANQPRDFALLMLITPDLGTID
jgi:hypothetical protein